MSDEKNLSSYREILHNGVRQFHKQVFLGSRERYQSVAGKAQEPHALFITCADSRIDPEALTQSGPGDIFVTRNIGNLVPPFGEMMGGVSAVIEYSVSALKVSQIVVCGHSDCGAMKGLLARESLSAMPTVNRWLNNAEAALSIVRARSSGADSHQILPRLIEENVLLQLNHLRTHPAVAGRLAEGALELYGWVYEIGEGVIREYDRSSKQWVSIV